MGILTPYHCPVAALPGPRWRAALSPHTLICGPGWHLPWPLPRSGACWPAPGVTPHQGGPQCCVCLQKLLGWAQDVSWACKPLTPIMCSVAPLRAGQGPRGSWRRVESGLPLLCLVSLMLTPLSVGSGHLGLPHLPFTSWLAFSSRVSWPFQRWMAQV